MFPFILSIDAGTTGITIVLINKDGLIFKKYCQEFTQYYPKTGWVEHDGEEIWLTTLKLLNKVFNEFNPKLCVSIGIANQRETTILWKKNTGKAIYNAIVWQCKRTSNICKKLKKLGYETLIKEKTGLIIDSYFSATKIKWQLENINNANKDAKNGDLAFGTIDSWLIWKLTGHKIHATDYTNASRTMLFNIDKLIWDNEILDILGIPNNILPEIKKSTDLFGVTERTLFGHQIPINGVAGDQQAALFGQQCFNFGSTKCTYGTGCFILTNTGKTRINSNSGLLSTIACDPIGKPIYAIEGSIFMGGAIIQWLRDELKLISDVSETEKIAVSIKDTNGVVIVPAFTGLGAPHWNMDARGIISGLTRGSNKNHIVRAALQSIALQVNDLLSLIIKDINNDISEIKVDGGASNNNFLMQFQSDIIQKNISRATNIESTALGAGLLAGIGSKFWDDINELKSFKKNNKIFTPKMKTIVRQKLLNEWENAVKRVCYN